MPHHERNQAMIRNNRNPSRLFYSHGRTNDHAASNTALSGVFVPFDWGEIAACYYSDLYKANNKTLHELFNKLYPFVVK